MLEGFKVINLKSQKLRFSLYQNGRLYVNRATLDFLNGRADLLLNSEKQEIALIPSPSGEMSFVREKSGGHMCCSQSVARMLLRAMGETDKMNLIGRIEEDAVIFGKAGESK